MNRVVETQHAISAEQQNVLTESAVGMAVARTVTLSIGLLS
jgi:hypothetical protein